MSHYEEEYAHTIDGKTCAGYDSKACKAPDMVNNPKHYNNHPSGVECQTIIEHFSYHLGCAVKYIWRCDDKFNAIEDLQKAIKSIQSEIDMRQRK